MISGNRLPTRENVLLLGRAMAFLPLTLSPKMGRGV